MPDSDFQAVVVVAVAVNLVEGIAKGFGVDAGAGFVMVVDLPSGI